MRQPDLTETIDRPGANPQRVKRVRHGIRETLWRLRNSMPRAYGAGMGGKAGLGKQGKDTGVLASLLLNRHETAVPAPRPSASFLHLRFVAWIFGGTQEPP